MVIPLNSSNPPADNFSQNSPAELNSLATIYIKTTDPFAPIIALLSQAGQKVDVSDLSRH